MKNAPAKYVKNPKTGVVFQQTRILEKMRKDLIPCTRAGIPIAHGNVDMPSLYNPFTDKIVPNSGDNSLIAGLIPCRDREHADEIRANLMGLPAEKQEETEVAGLKAPEESLTAPQLAATTEAPEVPAPAISDEYEGFKEVDVDSMEKPELKEFAMEHFGVKLNGQKGVDTLREELQTLINEQVAA